MGNENKYPTPKGLSQHVKTEKIVYALLEFLRFFFKLRSICFLEIKKVLYFYSWLAFLYLFVLLKVLCVCLEWEGVGRKMVFLRKTSHSVVGSFCKIEFRKLLASK